MCDNYLTRLQSASIVIFLMTSTSYFADCDMLSLSGCQNPAVVYNTSFSVLMCSLFLSILESSFGDISWKVTGSAALVFALLYYFYVPLSVYNCIIEIVRYLSLIWFFIQGLITIDIAHDIHLYIVKKAELAYNSRGSQASRPWYILHFAISSSVYLVIMMSIRLVADQYGHCLENKVAIAMTICATLLSTCFSLLEQCNKGGIIPAIVIFYTVLVFTNAILSNPNASCSSQSINAVQESEKNQNLAKSIANWLLFFTATTCIIYSALTGSASVVLTYKYFQSIIARPMLHFTRRGSCARGDSSRVLTQANDKPLDFNYNPDIDNYSNLIYSENTENASQNGGIDEKSFLREEENLFTIGFSNNILPPFDRGGGGFLNGTVTGASSSGAMGIHQGERSALLRDHSRMLSMTSSPGLMPCSHLTADEIWNNNSVLFKIQLGILSCYFAVLLSDWTAEMPGSETNLYRKQEAMYIKLLGSFSVWITFACVLINSYVIYRRYNRKLREIIRV